VNNHYSYISKSLLSRNFFNYFVFLFAFNFKKMKKICVLLLLSGAVLSFLHVSATYSKEFCQISTGMEVMYHRFRLPDVKSDADVKQLYKALYKHVHIFHVELDAKTKTATVISRPQVTASEISEMLRKASIASVLLNSEKRVEDAYVIEQKALERNRIANSLP
jgi:hypothetical protein